ECAKTESVSRSLLSQPVDHTNWVCSFFYPSRLPIGWFYRRRTLCLTTTKQTANQYQNIPRCLRPSRYVFGRFVALDYSSSCSSSCASVKALSIASTNTLVGWAPNIG